MESLATAEKRKRTRNVSVIFPLIRMAPPLSPAHKRRHSLSDRQLGKFDRKSRAFNGSKNMAKEISFSV